MRRELVRPVGRVADLHERAAEVVDEVVVLHRAVPVHPAVLVDVRHDVALAEDGLADGERVVHAEGAVGRSGDVDPLAAVHVRLALGHVDPDVSVNAPSSYRTTRISA